MASPRTLFNMILALALLLVVAKVQAASEPKPICSELLPRYLTVAGEEVFRGSETSYSFEDIDYGFVFEAYLSPEQILLFDAFLIDEERGLRSQQRGRHLFKLMIEHFGISRIQAIRARWSSGTNYDAYMSGLAQGMSPAEAAAQTWTGRLATEYGFGKIESVETEKTRVGGLVHIVDFLRSSI